MMLKLSDILSFLNSQKIDYVFKGDATTEVRGFSSLKNYKEGTFTWVKNQDSLGLVDRNLSLVFIPEGLAVNADNLICSDQSKLAFFSTVERFYYPNTVLKPVGSNTYIAPSVKLGLDVTVGANCSLDGDIEIGDRTVIGNNVVIMNKVSIGSDCQIQSGCIIGHDGFSWTEDENHIKSMVRHFGGVSIGNRVLICPNCVIDRGTLDDTVIKDGVKIDGLCFIAHNVLIEDNSILITGSKMYGSSRVGKNGYVATGLVRNHCVIGENAIVGMGSVVTKDVPDNTTVVGNPAKPIKGM